MLNEVKFSKFVNSGGYVTEIDLGDFLRCESVIDATHSIQQVIYIYTCMNYFYFSVCESSSCVWPLTLSAR